MKNDYRSIQYRQDVEPQESFLAVSGRDLEDLSATGAVDLFRDLLRAEASIGGTRINVPSSVYAPDGGIEAGWK